VWSLAISTKNEEQGCRVPVKKEFEDTKGVIKIRISKKNRQHNGQKKKYKWTNNDLQNIQKLAL
jgi:hypothetical protein